MPKINITFLEEGSTPVTVQLPAVAAQVLDLFIADQVTKDAEGNDVPKYSGKAELFLKHTTDSLITPLVDRYAAQIAADTASEIEALEQQKKQLEQSLKESVAPVIVTTPTQE